MIIQTNGLAVVTLAAPITLTYAKKGNFQRPPVTFSEVSFSVLDDGSRVTANFGFDKPLLLWGPNTTPPYHSNPPGTGAGDTWTTATALAQAQALIGTTPAAQLAAIKAMFLPGTLA
jgi:hypothetical protein